MVAVLGFVIVFLLAYIGSTWATIAQKDERIAQLESVLERRGGAWHEAPKKTPALPTLWAPDEHTRTMQCNAPPLPDEDKTDERVMVFE